MSDEIYQKLEQIIKEMKPSVKILKKEFNLRNDLNLDSLDTISFFFEVESAFGIKISEKDIMENSLLNIERLIEFINKKINSV